MQIQWWIHLSLESPSTWFYFSLDSRKNYEQEGLDDNVTGTKP